MVTGFTYNLINPSTDYQNGIDWHLDWGASQWVSKTVFFGAVGYFYEQLSPDRGCAPQLCPFESGVIGTASATKYGYDKDGRPILTKEPKLTLFDDFGGKPEGIHMMIGRRPYAAFGNSTGDQQMLEYTSAGDGARLMMLVLHDDAEREYAYGPAQGLPDTKVGTFTQALYDEAKKDGWTVVSMKNDWKRIFAFE